MNSFGKAVAALFVLVSAGAWAQEPFYWQDSDLFARLSYQSPTVVWRGDVRHVCVAVSADGEYRILRWMDDGEVARLHGKMSKEQFQQLTKLLESDKLRELSGHEGLIRQDAESFGAEILGRVREHADGTREWITPETWRLDWLNADGESPFPDSIAKIVDWLRNFQPKDGKSFEYTEYPDVCPGGGLRLVQPAVAENQHP